MPTLQISKQKRDIISWVARLEDRKLLAKLHREATLPNDEVIHLLPVQREMIEMSKNDIKNGRIVSEEELNKRDAQWLY